MADPFASASNSYSLVIADHRDQIVSIPQSALLKITICNDNSLNLEIERDGGEKEI